METCFLNWSSFFKHQKPIIRSNISIDYLIENNLAIDWKFLSKFKIFTLEELEKSKNSVFWEVLCRYQEFTDEYFYSFHDKINWYEHNIYKNMSMNIIVDFKDKIQRWDILCDLNVFSLNTLKELAMYIDWDCILKKQKLPDKFIEEIINLKPLNLYPSSIISYRICSEKLIEKTFIYYRDFECDKFYSEYFFWNLVAKFQKPSPDFTLQYYYQIDWKFFFKYQSKLPFLQEKYLEYSEIKKYVYEDYQKCIFLKNKILEYLYKPNGKMFKKTQQHFSKLKFD